MNDLERQLEMAQAKVRSTQGESDVALEDRRRIVEAALAAGMRPSKVAQLSGLSRQRIHQITDKGER